MEIPSNENPMALEMNRPAAGTMVLYGNNGKRVECFNLNEKTNCSYLFYGCKDIEFPEGTTFAGCTNGNYMFAYSQNIVISEGVTFEACTDGSNMFAYSQNIVIPEGVTFEKCTNGSYMFRESPSTVAHLPSSLTFKNLKTVNRTFNIMNCDFPVLELPNALFDNIATTSSTASLFWGCQSSVSEYLLISLPNATFLNCTSLAGICVGGSGGGAQKTSFSAPKAVFANSCSFEKAFYQITGELDLPLATFENATTILNAFNPGNSTYAAKAQVRTFPLYLPSATFKKTTTAENAFAGNKGGISLPLATFESCTNFNKTFNIYSGKATGVLNATAINMQNCTSATGFSTGQRMSLETLQAIAATIKDQSSSGTAHAITLGIDASLQESGEALAAIAQIEARGWTPTVQWNA